MTERLHVSAETSKELTEAMKSLDKPTDRVQQHPALLIQDLLQL